MSVVLAKLSAEHCSQLWIIHGWVTVLCIARAVCGAKPSPRLTPRSGQALCAKAGEAGGAGSASREPHCRLHCWAAAQHFPGVLPLGCSGASAGSCGLWTGGLGFVLAWAVGASQPPALLPFFCVYACCIVSETNLNVLI